MNKVFKICAQTCSIHWGRTLLTLVLLLPALVQAFPVIYVLSLSFKSANEVFRYPPTLVPENWTLENYSNAFVLAPLEQFLWNSFFVSLAIAALQVITSILAAYALARMEFWGKKFIYFVVVATMMIPGEVTIVPNYLTVVKLGWLDRYEALIVPFAASGFGVFLLVQFFRSIPIELEEAARMDGASRLRFLFQVMVPMSLPAITALGVYAFVMAWNQYLWPLIVTQSSDMRTVQIGVGMFRSENEASSWGVIMAATVILVLPSVAIFVSTQKYLVKGITMGGVKG